MGPGLEVAVGDVFKASDFTAVNESIKLGFRPDNDEYFVMLLLGTVKKGAEMNPEQLLNEMGWVRKET